MPDLYRKVRRAQREAAKLGLTGRLKRFHLKLNQQAVARRSRYIPVGRAKYLYLISKTLAIPDIILPGMVDPAVGRERTLAALQLLREWLK